MGPWLWGHVGCGEGREMLAGTAEEEPRQVALGLRDEDILVTKVVLEMEKVPKPGHGEVSAAPLYAQRYFQNQPSTNVKSIH